MSDPKAIRFGGVVRSCLTPWIWRMAWRDSRRERRRLAIFAISVVTGICALVTIHALRASLERGIDAQSKELLGSDLQISSSSDPGEDERFMRTLHSVADAWDREVSFSTMLTFEDVGEARLVQLRTVGGGFPFYGAVTTEPAGVWAALAGDEPLVLVEPALLDQFDVAIGDPIRLGAAALRIGGTVSQAAPRTGRFAGLAPNVYVNSAALEKTGLLERTRLANYHFHLVLPEGEALEAVVRQLREAAPELNWEWETAESRREQIGRVLDQFEEFLSLLAMFGLILGAVGVASAMQAQVSRRERSIAILRCLGVPPNAALAIYLVQAAVLGALASVVGGGFGVVLHGLVIVLFRDALPVGLGVIADFGVVARTTGLGFLACVGFALLPLRAVRSIPPLAVLRDASGIRETTRWGRFVASLPVALFAVGTIALLAVSGASGVWRGLLLVVGFVVVFLCLAAVGGILIFLARRAAKWRFPYVVRQGLANLFRPGNQTLLFVVALGLGVFLLALTMLLRDLMLRQVAVNDVEQGPNLYLVDVQPDQVGGVSTLLEGEGLPVLESAPMVAMRLSEINGQSVRVLRDEDRIPEWVLRREFRSSYRTTLNDTETTLQGAWPPADWTEWDGDSAVPLSVEIGLAEDLGLALGGTLAIDIQGVEIRAEVVHLREVDWSRFNLNFFLLFPPGVLEDAPGFHVVTTRIPEGMTSGRVQGAIAREFGNVSVIDLALILDTIRNILLRVAQAVQVLSGFTVVAGLCILAGIFLNGRERRIEEAVLLRTIGASRNQIRTILTVEFSALGALAAIAGGGLAMVAYALLTLLLFEQTLVYSPSVLLATILVPIVVSAAMGSLFSRGVATAPPLEILRR